MTDRNKVIEGLEYLITAYAFPGDDAQCLGDAVKLLKEQQEERERIVHWLSKFCTHIDQYPNGIKCSDAERYVFFKNKMHQQFGW